MAIIEGYPDLNIIMKALYLLLNLFNNPGLKMVQPCK